MATLSIPCLHCRATAQADEQASGVSCPSCGQVMPPPSAAAWMVSRDGLQPFGPYTIAQVTAYLGQSQLLPTDNLWHQGAPEWVQAGQLPALVSGGQQVGETAQAPGPVAQSASEPSAHSAFAHDPATGPYQQPEPAFPAPQPHHYEAQPQPYGAVAQPYGAPGQPQWTPAPAGPGFALHMKRAADWNLSRIEILPGEREQLLANGVDDDYAGRYLIWRRSVLMTVAPLTLVSALLAVVTLLMSSRWSNFSALGILMDFVRLFSLFAMPATAYMAAKIWYRQRKSRNLVLTGWAIAFATPLVLGLIPFDWALNVPATATAQERLGVKLIGAIFIFVTLMPAVLSLIPGVLRGCLRLKSLLPEATLPGWFLVAASPIYILLFLVIFSVINQAAAHFLLIVGVMALLISPVLYVVNASTFTRPLRTPDEIAKVGRVQNMALLIAAGGVVLLVLWTFIGSIGIVPGTGGQGKSLIGLTDSTSLIRPWESQALQFPLDFIGRSLFTTVVVADLIMQMNVSMWRYDKMYEGAPEAAHYDKLMAEIEEAGARPVAQPQPFG